jgi:zinc protease
MVYPRHHVLYTYALSSQEKQILEISMDDLRSFYETHYSPKGAIFGIAGNIDPDQVFALIEENFGSWNHSKEPVPHIKPVSLQRKYKEKTIHVEGKHEAKVIFGHYGNLARKSPDFYSAVVMNFILGGGEALSSRIGKRLREDLGLVYSISSGFNAMSIAGSWNARFGVDSHYADMAIQALKEEITKFIENGVTDSELDLAKSYLIGSYPLRFTNNGGIARALLINEFYNLGDNYLNEYTGIIDAITREEVNESAKKYLHPEVASVVKAGSFKAV